MKTHSTLLMVLLATAGADPGSLSEANLPSCRAKAVQAFERVGATLFRLFNRCYPDAVTSGCGRKESHDDGVNEASMAAYHGRIPKGMEPANGPCNSPCLFLADKSEREAIDRGHIAGLKGFKPQAAQPTTQSVSYPWQHNGVTWIKLAPCGGVPQRGRFRKMADYDLFATFFEPHPAGLPA
jgi:hypothetical protein